MPTLRNVVVLWKLTFNPSAPYFSYICTLLYGLCLR
jgi:hypothetical protein